LYPLFGAQGKKILAIEGKKLPAVASFNSESSILWTTKQTRRPGTAGRRVD
jgi:hypothetical protein